MNKALFWLILIVMQTASWSTIAQPLAAFDHDHATQGGCTPSTITFTNQSTGSVASYSWSIDGNEFSVLENPIRTFTAAGTFAVCLEVEDNAGQTNQACQDLSFYSSPSINLTANPALICEATDVQLNLNSSIAISVINWDFGDGTVLNQPTSGTTATQTHRYTNTGSYTITATVYDINGCEATLVESNLVVMTAPINPDFTADVVNGCNVPQEVNFSATPTGPNYTYSWDFGDGNTASGATPSHTYQGFGNYDIQLIVSNSTTGCTDEMIKTDYVNLGNIAAFSYSLINDGDCSTTDVQFSGSIGSNVTSILWDFDDGTTSTEANPTHSYTAAGCYRPSLTLMTSDGCNASMTLSDCIQSLGPLTFDYNSNGVLEGCDAQAGLPVQFTATTSLPATYSWNFGTLGVSSQTAPTFNFNQYGIHPVALTATFENGCTETLVKDTVKINPIEIAFVADTTQGCVPLEVQFTSTIQSNDPIVDYAWDFGSTTSTDANPLVTFTDTGFFDVTLTVTSQSGCMQSLTLYEYIEAGQAPNISFQADMTTSCADTSITFSNTTTGPVDEWEWQFGDGGTSGQFEPMHQYADTGIFDVQLIAWHHGCSDTLLLEDYIQIVPPLARFTISQDCNTPFEVAFSDASSGAQSWAWDFGDGMTSTSQNPSHTFAQAGRYEVVLVVTNTDAGCQDRTTRMIDIGDGQAQFSLSETVICAGDTVSVINPNPGNGNYQFNFPNGVAMLIDQPNDPEPQFYFTGAGSFTGFELTYTDAAGCVSTFQLPDTVKVAGVFNDFAADWTMGCPPFDVQFTNNSTSTAGGFLSYLWDFGDGNTSTSENPMHSYTSVGAYDVRLTITSLDGCVATRLISNLVTVVYPKANFTTNLNDCSTNEIAFSTLSTGGTLTHAWAFGDGGVDSTENPVHAYAVPGRYEVCLTVSNSPGCIDQFCDSIDVSNIVADFTGDELYKSCASPPLVTNFTDASKNAVSWSWDFGDGTALSTIQNPSHAYSKAGKFTVCLTVMDVEGCSNVLCKNEYIEVDGPDGEFTINSASGCVPFDVTFVATGSEVAIYNWDFGDGNGEVRNNTSGSESITHTYTNGGMHVPVLVVEDASGCRISILGDTIEAQDLQIDFTTNLAEQCEENLQAVDINSLIVNAGTVLSYEWQFNGGQPATSTSENPRGIQFSSPGYYDISLRVQTAECDATIQKDSFIVVHPQPQTAFNLDAESGCAPFSPSIQNTSTISTGQISQWNWQLGNGETSTDANPNPIYEQPGTYVIQLQATSEASCSATFSDTIEVFEMPVIRAGADHQICIGEVARLEVDVSSGQVSQYEWSPAEGLSCTLCPDPIANPIRTTTYTITATSPDGCQTSDTVLVTVSPFPAPSLTVTQDTGVCLGQQMPLLASSTTSPATFEWDRSRPGLSCYTCPNPVAGITQPTTFVVTVTSAGNCTNVDSVFVAIYSNQLDFMDRDRTICVGDSVQLNLRGGNEPQWTPATGLSCNDCPNPIASPTATTNYTISVQTDEGCVLRGDLTVTVMEQEDVDAGMDDIVCPGTPFEPFAVYEGQGAWYLNGQQVAGDETSPSLNVTEDAQFVLEVRNDLCVLTDTVSATMLEQVSIEAEDQLICKGEEIQLEVRGNATSYRWSPAQGLSAIDIPNPMALPNETTTYMIVGSIEDCEGDTIYMTVEVLPGPGVNITTRPYFSVGQQVELETTVTGVGNYTYEWSPTRFLSCSDCPNPIATPDGPIVYEVLVTDENGCEDQASISLENLEICGDNGIVVPTAFTPNGDGENDELFVRGITDVSLFRVYNRWGEVVYETNNGDDGWNGMFNGEQLNRDVFVYYVEAVCPYDGSTVVKTGDVTLLR